MKNAVESALASRVAPLYGFFWGGFSAGDFLAAILVKAREPAGAADQFPSVGELLFTCIFLGGLGTVGLILGFNVLEFTRRKFARSCGRCAWCLVGFDSAMLIFDTQKLTAYLMDPHGLGGRYYVWLNLAEFATWPAIMLLIATAWDRKQGKAPSAVVAATPAP
jgi:hypothetical protein